MNKKIKSKTNLTPTLSFGEGWGGALILIIIFTISSCRKYPEGGTVKSITNKLKKGSYEFKHYYVDGIDSVNYYFIENEKNNYFKVSPIQFITLEDGTPDKIYYYYIKHVNDTSYYFLGNGSWNLSNKQKSIQINFHLSIVSPSGFDSTITRGPMTTRTEWDIMKLEDDDFFLETNYGGKHYRLELH